MSLSKLILILGVYLSFARGTNINFFYPPNSDYLGTIDYTLQTSLNYLLILMVAGYFFLSNNYRLLVRGILHPKIFPILVLCVLSIAFSVNPVKSIKFLLTVIAISTFPALYIAEFGREKLIQALSKFIVALCFINILYTLALPYYGIMAGQHAGSWRGMFIHKNIAGPFFSVGFFFICYQLQMRAYTWRIVPFTALAICLIFVVFSKSATALVTFVIMAGLYLGFILLLRSKHAIQRLALSLALIFSAFFVVLFAGEYLYYSFFELIGKDPSFTGRTNIWAALIGLANERPLIGYGIGMAQDPSFLTRIHGALTFEVASTHNSFFDVLLNIGYPGAVILVVIMAIQLIGILLKRQYNVQERRQNALILSVIITMLIIGFTSGDVLIGRSMFWLYIFCGLLLAEYALKHAHRAHKLQTEA